MRFIMSLDENTHKVLERLAAKEERSMAATVRYLIKQEAAKKLTQVERRKVSRETTINQ